MLDSSDRKGSPLQRESQRFKANCYSLGRRIGFRFLGGRSTVANLHNRLLINHTSKSFKIKYSEKFTPIFNVSAANRIERSELIRCRLDFRKYNVYCPQV